MKSSTNTGVKSVDEQKSETEANENAKEVKNKNNEETSTQPKSAENKITAASISSALSPAKTDDKAATPNKPNSAWEQLKNSRFPKEDSTSIGTQNSNQLNSGTNGQSRMDNMFSDMDKMIQSNSSDPKTVGEKYGIASPDQNQSSSSQQQSSSLNSPSMNGGSGGYFNNVVVGNNSGNVIGDTGGLTGGGISGGDSITSQAQALEPIATKNTTNTLDDVKANIEYYGKREDY